MNQKFKIWGPELVDGEAIKQMENACSLPVSVKGALMPDGHVGYGLPIGGVLATDNVVIPYAVGVDISCSVKISIFDIPPIKLIDNIKRFKKVIEDETRFGVGAHFSQNKRKHAVMDADWSITPVTATNKDKAWEQLGTSGSGNHFVEFGIFTIGENTIGLAPGDYLALLSHSGSRGVGAMVCNYYSNIAKQKCASLEHPAGHLSWLSLNDEAGKEYWNAMQLMHRYAEANHELIHKHIAENLGAHVLFSFINSHNLAWEEEHYGKKLIVHRKGATPAGKGQLGIIPGSMASSTYLVKGLGEPESLKSCSHGAGRQLGRKKAKETLNKAVSLKKLKEKGVTLMSAGLDEMPAVYKDIHKVMEAQKDLVEIVGEFRPILVKMAGGNEPAED